MDMICTRLWPASGLFVGKSIHPDGRIHADANIKWWRHARLSFASLEALQDDLQQTLHDNCCLVRGTTESTTQPIRRRHPRDGEPGFDNTPTTFFALDVEGVHNPDWLADAPVAIDASVIAPLRAFVQDSGYLIALSSSAGLVRNPETRAWSGAIGGDEVRCRVYFHLCEPLDSYGAKLLMRLMRDRLPGIDIALADWIQIHYCARPRFIGRAPPHDPLVDHGVPLLWLRSGRQLELPPDLEHAGQWAAAEEQARAESISSARRLRHPDVESALAAIGEDGEVYPHIKSAAWLLLHEGCPDNITPAEHAQELYQAMRKLTLRHREAILRRLPGREWKEIETRLERGRDYLRWLIEHSDGYRGQGVLRKRMAWSDSDEGFSLAAGRAALSDAGDAFVQAFDDEDPTIFDPRGMVRSLRSTLGGGKSHTAYDVIARLLLRALEDNAPVIYASSRHVLGAEHLQRFSRRFLERDVVCAQWRGRQAGDLLRLGRPMCERHEEAHAVALAGGDPQLLCRNGPMRCSFYGVCGYRRQQKLSAHIWFVAHDALLHERPPNIGQPIGVIIDENPVPAMLFGIDSKEELALDALRTPPTGPYTPQDAATLTAFRRALWEVFDKLPLGPMPVNELRTKFAAHPQVASDIQRMINLEWANLAPLKVHPGMDKETVIAAAGDCGDNVATLLRITLYELIREAVEDGIQVSGRITVVQHGRNGRVLQMRGIRPLRVGWRAPILALDATLDLNLLRRIWPQAAPIVPDIKFAMSPHVRVTQVVNAPFSKSWLTGKGRELKRAREVYGAILGEIILAGTVGPTLIVTHKAVEEQLREHAHVPDWVMLAHHGDIAGIDRWKSCRNVVVIGRPLPPAESACQTAEALFGEAVPAGQRPYTPTKVNLRIVPDAHGNTAVEVTQLRHGDPRVEAVRWQVTEGGVLQAAGRGRGVARTAADPLDIWLLTNVRCEELEPVHARLWAEFPCGPDAQMLAMGVWLESHTDAARAYPQIFNSEQAVRHQRRRRSIRSFIHRES